MGFSKMFAIEFWGINHASEGHLRWAKTPFRTQTGLFKHQTPPTIDGGQINNPIFRTSPFPLSKGLSTVCD